jgi:glutamate synthase (NADPH/NADH) small chain
MGKPTGFLEYERLSEAYAPVEQRLKHYKEFVVTLSDEEAAKQGRAAWTAASPSATTAAR